MANFNYLDFIVIPNDTDTKLSIKDNTGVVVYTINPFKVESTIIQNNNIKINFYNTDSILIAFNSIFESKSAIVSLQSYINQLRNKIPDEIDKQTQLYIDHVVSLIPRGNTGSTGPAASYIGTSSTFITIPDVGSGVLLSTQPYLSYSNNQTLIVSHNENVFYGYINSYDMISGTLSMTVSSVADANIGLTFSYWQLNLSGEKGASIIGPTGNSGNDGINGINGIDGEKGLPGTASIYLGTSSTYITIPEAGGYITMTTQPYLSYSTNQTLIVSHNANSVYIDYDYWEDSEYAGIFYGEVDFYDPISGTLSLVVSAVADTQIGLTFSFWYINLSGTEGVSGASASTADLTFTYSTITTLYNDENIYIQTRGTASLFFTDNYSHSNFSIAGTNSDYVMKQGDTVINNNLVLGGAIYYDSYIQNRSNNYGWIELTSGTYSVIDSFSASYRTSKYLVSCDVQTGTASAMSCEIISVNSSEPTIAPLISVYGIVSTTSSQFVTFDIRRQFGNNSTVELIAYTDLMGCYLSTLRQYIIYPKGL
jgi:hypothetical protein